MPVMPASALHWPLWITTGESIAFVRCPLDLPRHTSRLPSRGIGFSTAAELATRSRHREVVLVGMRVRFIPKSGIRAPCDSRWPHDLRRDGAARRDERALARVAYDLTSSGVV